MNAIFILLAASAIVGLVFGFYFTWVAILVSGLALAFLSAAVLQNEGFGFLAGIAIIVACLSVNQFAYQVGGALACGGPWFRWRFGNATSLPPQQRSKRK